MSETESKLEARTPEELRDLETIQAKFEEIRHIVHARMDLVDRVQRNRWASISLYLTNSERLVGGALERAAAGKE